MNHRLAYRGALLAGLALGAPGAASAQLYLNSPSFQGGPIEPNDPLVGLPLPGATPAEYRAHRLWNLRAGLNVAALSCQSWPFLRTVANYNALLAHHSGELATAYTALEGYFRRVNGRTGPRQFDIYSTQTYQNFGRPTPEWALPTAARSPRRRSPPARASSTSWPARGCAAAQQPAAGLRTLRLHPPQIRLTPIRLVPIDCSRLPARTAGVRGPV